MRRDVERLFERQQQVVQRVGEGLLDPFRRLDPVAPRPLLELFEQVVGCFKPDVARQQQRFQFFEQFLVDLAAGEDRLELAAELRARTRQPGLEALAPGQCRHRRRFVAGLPFRGWLDGFLEETKHGDFGSVEFGNGADGVRCRRL